MINLKRCNFVTGDLMSVSYAVNRIVKFLEDDGRNPLLFCKPRSSSSNTTSLKYFIDNKLEFNNFEEFKNIIKDDGNLFRVDLLIFDFWHLNVSSIIDYKSVIDKLNIDYIIVAKEYHYKSSDDVTDYHVRSEIKNSQNILNMDPRSEYWITDKISGWTSDLDALSKSYIRDKRIDTIINKDSK